MATKVLSKGEMLVTDTGEVVIDEVIPRSRAMLVAPENYISVEFDPNEPPPPPCAGGLEDELDWELFMKQHHDHHVLPHHPRHEEELKLKIVWRVQTARTVIWQISVPV
jgi:hypothetical protein